MRLEILDLADFKDHVSTTLHSFEQVWPLFDARGFSRDGALAAFSIWALADYVESTLAELAADDDEGEEWRG